MAKILFIPFSLDFNIFIIIIIIIIETNIQINSNRKAVKYNSLLSELATSYNTVTFINLSMGAIGAMGSSCTSFFSLLNDLGFDKTIQKRIIIKTMKLFHLLRKK